jgi:hypothetical protein
VPQEVEGKSGDLVSESEGGDVGVGDVDETLTKVSVRKGLTT